MKKIALVALSAFMFLSALAQEAPEGLFLNSNAPNFTAKDQNGNNVRMRDMLKKGKVILVFYHGYWSPHCTKYLSRLQDSLQLLTEKKATVIAISPELPENITMTAEKTKASFSLIHDEELKIMKAYDVDYLLSPNTLNRYRNGGIKIDELNGKNGNFLPITATYIIDKESNVSYRFFEQDPKKRPSVKELLDNL